MLVLAMSIGADKTFSVCLHGGGVLLAVSLYTVTRLDVSFRYPDRVPLTHFVHRAKNFPAVSVVTCRDFLALPFLAPEGRDFPAVSVVSGRDFPAVAFLVWVI